MMSDRVLGVAMALVALTYIVSATQIPVSFLSDPVGPKGFPILVGAVGLLASLVIAFRPDPSPTWPGVRSLAALAITFIVMLGYAFALKPLGFLIPTVIVSGIVSFQITPHAKRAVFTGVGISIVLFVIFRYALGLGLMPFPRAWMAGWGG